MRPDAPSSNGEEAALRCGSEIAVAGHLFNVVTQPQRRRLPGSIQSPGTATTVDRSGDIPLSERRVKPPPLGQARVEPRF